MSVQKYCVTVLRIITILGFFCIASNMFLDTDDRFQEILAGVVCVGTGMQYLANLADGKEEWR